MFAAHEELTVTYLGHQTGNLAFNKLVENLFGSGFTDILSGYRVFSRRFAKSLPTR